MNDKFSQLKGIVAEMIERAGSGHYASSVSALEIMVPLFYEQGIQPDQFILSKGHAAPALYAILYDKGFLSKADLDSFREYGGLPGHPELGTTGVLCSSGSLGMGISKVVGLAHANPDREYHVLVGDGEQEEGQISEALIYLQRPEAPRNIIVHVDFNGMTYSGPSPHTEWQSAMDIVIFHHTTWEHDNHYLTNYEPADLPYTDRLIREMWVNPEMVVLNADLEHDFGLTTIKESYPSRYIQCGICEQHMVSMANGLALAGKIPICHTFGAFYRRAIDQMYNNACDGLRVGYVAGLCNRPAKNIGRSHMASPRELYKRIGVKVADNLDQFFDILQRQSVYVEVF